MSCFHPRPAFEQVHRSTGEVSVSIWHPIKGHWDITKRFMTKCDQCSGCRSSYTRSWSLRCWHESLFHKENCFLTLTVNEDSMESVFPGRSLCYEPFQVFIRALRKRLRLKLRFFMCGEYGEQFSRPHYHAIIFGWYPSVSDRTFYKSTPAGDLYVSKAVSQCWPFGFHTIGTFSRESAGYVAGYMQKKIKGKLAPKWYGGRHPEFAKCSNGGGSKTGGLGKQFYSKFKRDLYDAKDAVTLPGGSKVSIPRYYDKLHSFYHPSHMEKVKLRRQEPDALRDFESTPARLAVREHIHRARLSKLRRSLH